MEKDTLEQLRYPIGKFELPEEITEKDMDAWIMVLEQLPERLSRMVSPLTAAQLDTPYRPEG